ncbi:hypothetical protein V499_00290 [Pseudogymnoascus sp. VKM F-103]|nr:hypothetical protein V499_00290 [Pseudogymnoascus sp. VKM F-103]
MENDGDIDWGVFFNETPNERSTHTVMDTTIPNPGVDTISDSDIAALETWVQENSTIDTDAPDCRQDHSQSPQDRLYRPRESLPALGQIRGFSDLALEMQQLRQMIYNQSQALSDFSKIADDAHDKVEEASAKVNITLRRAARLKEVYDQLIQWSVDMQGAVTREAHRSGLAVVDH